MYEKSTHKSSSFYKLVGLDLIEGIVKIDKIY